MNYTPDEEDEEESDVEHAAEESQQGESPEIGSQRAQRHRRGQKKCDHRERLLPSDAAKGKPI